jgi:hypothetical protein
VKGATLVVLWSAVVACGPRSNTPVIDNRTTAPATVGPTLITSICTDKGDETAIANWPAIKHPGTQFVLLDTHGYVATFRIGTDEIDCDDCEGESVGAVVVDRGELQNSKCYIAVGPVDAPLRHARVVKEAESLSAKLHAPSDWSAIDQLDLNGDGRVDLSLVSRCASVVPSGCNDHVCNKKCTGVLRAGEPTSKVDELGCVEFVPDIHDCHP